MRREVDLLLVGPALADLLQVVLQQMLRVE